MLRLIRAWNGYATAGKPERIRPEESGAWISPVLASVP